LCFILEFVSKGGRCNVGLPSWYFAGVSCCHGYHGRFDGIPVMQAFLKINDTK
jgi:hypothetical protein